MIIQTTTFWRDQNNLDIGMSFNRYQCRVQTGADDCLISFSVDNTERNYRLGIVNQNYQRTSGLHRCSLIGSLNKIGRSNLCQTSAGWRSVNMMSRAFARCRCMIFLYLSEPSTMKQHKCSYCHKRIPMPPDFTICGYCEEILEDLEHLNNAIKYIKAERE